jgi:hypothetical protein
MSRVVFTSINYQLSVKLLLWGSFFDAPSQSDSSVYSPPWMKKQIPRIWTIDHHAIFALKCPPFPRRLRAKNLHFQPVKP